jgi:biofilm PGA synthesis protein PgaD
VDDQGLSASFKLTDERLETLRQPGSKIIHNNPDGDISHVVPHFHLLSPDLQPPPLAPLDRPTVIHLPADHSA